MGMRKLKALLVAFAIIFVALMPGVGAVFTMKAGDRPPPPERIAPPQERIDLMGSYVAMQPGVEEGALALSRVRTNAPLPPNASPVLTR